MSNINPYLVDAAETVLLNRRTPISKVPSIVFGSMPNDGGFLLLSPVEKAELLAQEPKAERWIRQLLGSVEFINNLECWCLWLINISPDELRSMPMILERVEAVRRVRLASSRNTTKELASFPALFGEIRQPKNQYLAIPKTSSELRIYLPIGFLSADVIASTELFTIDGASNFHFGILSSAMHMAWVRSVCGRLESRYRYSAGIVYNNFPWPTPSDKQREAIEAAAQGVLDARAEHPGASLADLYDPLAMPPNLVKAHQRLDAAVDAAYAKKKFTGDSDRVAFLFERYQQLTAPLAATKPAKSRRKVAGND